MSGSLAGTHAADYSQVRPFSLETFRQMGASSEPVNRDAPKVTSKAPSVPLLAMSRLVSVTVPLLPKSGSEEQVEEGGTKIAHAVRSFAFGFVPKFTTVY